jgi:hypothetical protein
MREVKVKRGELVAKVHANREKHIAEYQLACAGYKQDALASIDNAVAALRAQIGALKEGELIRLAAVQFSLPYPESHEEDYDQVLEMLSMSVDDEITIQADDFACYAMDKWDWKKKFDAIRMSYSNAR